MFDTIVNSLFLFHKGTLHLLPCIPADWLDGGKEIRVERAQTPFGEVNFCVKAASSSEISVELHRVANSPVLISIPPACGTIQAVSFQGSEIMEEHFRFSSYQGTIMASILLIK